jgi:glycosyltransferase involved in cell wall biosynthesis
VRPGNSSDEPLRLGVYVDVPYRRDEDGYAAEEPFVLFPIALRPHFSRVVLIGRLDPVRRSAPYRVPADVGVAALPYYKSLKHLRELVRAVPASLRAIWDALSGVDAVWAIGPHPMSLPVVLLAVARRRTVVLGVRQQFFTYVRHRLPHARWTPTLGAALVLEGAFRLLARRLSTVAVGPELARQYGHGRAPVLELVVSLVPERETEREPRERLERDGPVELLSVGRLDPEKAPRLLLEMMHHLDRDDSRGWRLTIAGSGELEAQISREAGRLGQSVRVLGHVAFGPRLFDLYRNSDILVHSSFTEGVPQVFAEAHAFRLPIVATDVGGVRGALEDGAAGVLVPPNDAESLAQAVRRLAASPERRDRLVARGAERARDLTLERQANRVARFIYAAARR